MSAPGFVYLMYHELESPGRPLCQDEPGYVRYIVRESDFRAQMLALNTSGQRGLSVSEALASTEASGVAITFDDGCETDLLTAAPILRESGFNATFYVTVGFLGKRGYMSRTQVRTLSDLGCEIGSHSMTHPYLSDLNDDQLKHEIGASRKELEQITGRAVKHFSCPGGRWDQRVVQTAENAGYSSVATSRAEVNSATAKPFALGRVAIMRQTDLVAFEALSKGQGLLGIRLRDRARGSLKRLLGNSFYDHLRDQVLKKKPEKR